MSEENNIVNQNADEQGAAPAVKNTAAEASTATTNEPVQEASPDVVEKPERIVVQEPVAETVAAHDDFDWSIDKRNVSHYSPEEKAKYDKVYEDTFVAIEDGEIVNGTVVALTKTDAVINIGFKSDGLVSLNEFRDKPNMKIGDDRRGNGRGKRRPGRPSFSKPQTGTDISVHGKELLKFTKRVK